MDTFFSLSLIHHFSFEYDFVPSNTSKLQLHYQSHLDDWRAGPMGLASAQQAYLRTRRNPADGQINPMDVTVPPLPEGWKEELDEATGVYFYVHDESGKRSWVRPNFRPPGPGGVGPPPPPMMGGGPQMMGGTSLLELFISILLTWKMLMLSLFTLFVIQIILGPPPNFRGPPPPPQFQQPPPQFSGLPPPQFAPPPMGGP